MDTLAAIEQIERSFRFRLPCDYRTFLIQHPVDLVESLEVDALVPWPRGPAATVDRLCSSASILENDASEASCDPERKMLIIGHSMFGGYLYLCWEPEQFGRLFFREPFQDPSYYLVAESFEDFLVRSRPMAYDDEA
jgi:hypothetical protein